MSETCLVSKKCGGCNYIATPYSDELKKKQKMMYNLLSEFGKVNPIIGMENPFYYRNKVHHVFGYNKGKILAGCYEANSHRVVDIKECFIEDKECQDIIFTIKKLVPSFKIKIYDEDRHFGLLRHVLVRKGFKSGEIMVVLVMASTMFPGKNNFVKALLKEHPNITTIVLNVNDADTTMVLGDREVVLYGPGFIKDELCGLRFRISAKSFYQVNPVQTEILYGKAMEYAGLTGKERVLDAYCGTGTIGLIASKNAKSVIGVELNGDAVKDARINAKENKINNATFIKADATEYMKRFASEGEKVDVLFMDPPRSGSTPEFIKAAVSMAPKKIVYISCGPDTLKRDLKQFVKMGYDIKAIQPVDMFAKTNHVETVCLLSRK